MILSFRRILEATYVMKVKLFIRSHGLKIESCVWNDFSEIQKLYDETINLVEFVFLICEELS